MTAQAEDVSLPAGFIAALAAASNQPGVLAATAAWIPRIIEVGRSSIALPSGSQHLQVMTLGGTTIIPTGTVFPVESSLVGRAFESGKVQVVGDLCHTDYVEAEALASAGIRAAMIGPMASGGRCLGTLNLGHHEPDHFTHTDELLLMCIAGLVGSYLNVLQLADDARTRATFDDLTGALTRRAGLAALEAQCRSQSAQAPAVIYLDLDNFKSVNDSHGHQTGDETLRIVAARISTLLDGADHLVRLGGDEFLVIVSEDPTAMRARTIAESIQRFAGSPISIRSIQIEPRVSMGVAHVGNGAKTAFELLGDADQAMYDAKAGLGVVVADENTRLRTTQMATIDRDLDVAMANRSMGFHYQPIRHLHTGEILGAEALVRWDHPELGWLPAPLIVNRIEATGRIDRFTQWSLETVGDDLCAVRQQIPAFCDKAFSVNMTPRQLAWPLYPAVHLTSCDMRGLRACDLLIEIVESAEIRPGDKAERNLRTIHEAGGVIGLDDFGTGHNALGYFTRFPIDAVKFDRSLVGVVATNDAALKILKALTLMATDLGVTALAEGVETAIESELCRGAGIEHGQGWHFGKPMPLDAFIALADQELNTQAIVLPS